MIVSRGYFGRVALLLGAVVVLYLAVAARADAFVYWTNQGADYLNPAGTLGRANTDGTGVNQRFITNAGAGPCLLAVNSTNLFWANTGGTTIGRAEVGGTGVNPNFSGGADNACGVAVNSSFLYWADNNGIGRANLNGTNPTPGFIPGGFFCGVTVDSSHIYWGNFFGNSIGRADLNGGNANPSFITGLESPCGVAVDSSHIYWANDQTTSTTIGRANLDGNPASVNNAFITGGNYPCGVTVFNGMIYWANFGNGTVGRANVNGTGVNQNFITGADHPCGPVVDAPNSFSFRVQKKQLMVSVLSPGTVSVADAKTPLNASESKKKKKKKKVTLKASSATGNQPTITVQLLLSKAGKSALKKKGKVKFPARITFTPQGGTAKTQTATLQIKGKKKKRKR